jgi:hypothetical protein
MNFRLTRSSAHASSESLGHDTGVLGEAWRQFAQRDAATTAPAELERRTLAAWEALQQRPHRGLRPGQRRLFWAVGAVAAALLLAVALNNRRPTTVPTAPASSVALSGTREVEALPRGSRPTSTAHAVITWAVDPVLETETLQLVRVRMPRVALQAVGVVVSGPNADGFVDVDVVVGEDGLPRDVRRVALVPE